MRNIMIDIETLGTSQTSLILSIGAVEFTAEGVTKGFEVNIQPESCEALGLTVDVRTVMWWLDQPKEAQNAFFVGKKVNLPRALIELTTAFNWKDAVVWSNGSDFDFPILENAFKACDVEAPWKYYNKRDFRTLKRIVPSAEYDEIKVDATVGHKALDDAKSQALTLINIMNYLGLDL